MKKSIIKDCCVMLIFDKYVLIKWDNGSGMVSKPNRITIHEGELLKASLDIDKCGRETPNKIFKEFKNVGADSNKSFDPKEE